MTENYKELAFVMLSHRQPDAVFRRLLNRLSEIQNAAIGIHHDFGQSDFPQELIDEHDLSMVNDWTPTQWGHASKVPATLKVFRDLLENTSAEWFITISPNCYPLKATTGIADFFRHAQSDAMVEMRPVLKGSPPGILRNKYRFLFSKRLFAIPWISKRGQFYFRDLRIPVARGRTPFAELTPYQGSDWFALRRRVVEKMLSKKIEEGDVLAYLSKINRQKNTLVSPIEMVIQTFLGNESDINIETNNYRFIDWENAKNFHPNTLTMKHWSSIRTSNALFARKFSPSISDELLCRIDQEVLVCPRVSGGSND